MVRCLVLIQKVMCSLKLPPNGGYMNNFENFSNLNKKEKEDKKKGFIGWLREKLGFAPRGMGNLSEGARSINLANIGRFGSLSSRTGIGGILSFIGGKGTLATLALVALAVGTTLYYKNMDNKPVGSNSGAYMGDTSYVPRIMREQQAGSTLDMFKQANKGVIKEEDDIENKYKNPEEPKTEAPITDANLDLNKDSQGVDRKRLQTDMQFGLSTSFGSGTSNKFSNLGGFGNHMGKFGPSVGSGFSKLSDINSLIRKATGGKLSAMGSQKRPVIARAPTLKGIKGGKTAFDQAKAIKGIALQPNYGSADMARYTLDKAWEGTTGSGGVGGVPSGGSGISSGGEGIIQTPSTLDNIGDTAGNIPDNQVPGVPGKSFDTPWASLLQKAMMLLMISAVLAGIASMVANIKPWGMIVAIVLAMAAVAMAAMVIMIGMQIMKVYGQNKLGMIYVMGGALAIASAIAAIAGVYVSWATLLSQILAAAAGIMAMFASMAAGPAAQNYMKKQMEEQQKQYQQQTSKATSSYYNLLT